MALPPPTPAPYFTIRFSAVGGSPLAYWIPSASILRVPTGPQGWLATLPAEDALLRATTAGLQPFAAPTRAPVLVGYRPVQRPIGYLRLFTIGAPVTAAPSAGGWLTISIQGGRTPSPWTDGTTSFLISRRGGFLSRDGRVFRISTTLARRIRSRLPLTG